MMAEWFAPKRYGYGAGPPIAWQGWAILALYIATIGVAAFTLLPDHWWLYIWVVAVSTGAITLVAARTTRGGWRWRWGGDE